MNEEFNKALANFEDEINKVSVKRLFDDVELLRYDGLTDLTEEFYSQTLKRPPRNFTNKNGRNYYDEYSALLSLVEEYKSIFRDIPYGVFIMDDKTPILIVGQIIQVMNSAEFMKNDFIYCLGAIMYNSSITLKGNFKWYVETYGRDVIVGDKTLKIRLPLFLNKEGQRYGRWFEEGYRKDVERKKLIESKLETIKGYTYRYEEGLKEEADKIQVQSIEKIVRRYCERINKKAKDWVYELVALKDIKTIDGLNYIEDEEYKQLEEQYNDLEYELRDADGKTEHYKTNKSFLDIEQKKEDYEKEREVFGKTLCKVNNQSDEYIYDNTFELYFAINNKREVMLMQFTAKSFEKTEMFNDDIITKL